MRTALVVAALSFGSVGVAEAHIHLIEPLSRTDDAQGNPQKLRGCGDPTVTRIASRVSTFKPGQKITVKWQETIPHPGYYRIAFQPNGETFHIPKGDPNATNRYPTENLTGMTDAATGTMVLADQILDGTLMMDVTLPNMECTNCTLQLIQLMTNNPPYNADIALDGNANDIYYQCADITLAADAPDAGMQPTPDAGNDEGGGSNNGTGGGEISGGCSTGNATGLGALALLGLVGLRRRRR